MGNWTTESALLELEKLSSETEELSKVARFSAPHTRWVAQTLTFLEEVFGLKSRYYLTFASLPWGATGSFIIHGWNPDVEIEVRHHEAYLRNLESSLGLLQAAADELQRKGIVDVYRGKNTPPESSAIVKVLNLTEQKLRKVVRKPPSAEKEVQDAFENLLIASELSYLRESERIAYSSKDYVPDFTLQRLDLAIDMKLCTKQEHEKSLIAEINDDILAYRTKFGNLLFVVYDVGVIRDVERFVANFERNEGVLVRVVKH